jgi:BASS family bile acid:Na+ symporter
LDSGKLIAAAFSVSVFLVVAGFALDATWQDITFLFKRPMMLGRSLLATFVIMPVAVAVLVVTLDFTAHIEVALVLLAVSPVFPMLPKKVTSVGVHRSYAFGLLATAALLSVALVPLSIGILSALFGKDISVSYAVIVKVVTATILAPLVLGVLVREYAPAVADRIKRLVSG